MSRCSVRAGSHAGRHRVGFGDQRPRPVRLLKPARSLTDNDGLNHRPTRLQSWPAGTDRSEIGPYLGDHRATSKSPTTNSASPMHFRGRAISTKAPLWRTGQRSATLNPAGSLACSADRTLGRETTFPARQEDAPRMSGSQACSNLLKYLGPTSRQFEKAQSGTARASTPLLPANRRDSRHIEQRSEHRLTEVQPLANFQNVLGC